MSILNQLQNRCDNTCEICSTATNDLKVYVVPPKKEESVENAVALCADCYSQISANNFSNSNYWHCTTASIWDETPAVQALSYKILTTLKNEAWAMECIDSVYVDENVVEWANAEAKLEAEKIVHKDSYGVILESGDTVVLIQNLNVKGANFIAPKGTIVRKIRLVADNAEQIEGKIEGDTIVILTKYVRKSV